MKNMIIYDRYLENSFNMFIPASQCHYCAVPVIIIRTLALLILSPSATQLGPAKVGPARRGHLLLVLDCCLPAMQSLDRNGHLILEIARGEKNMVARYDHHVENSVHVFFSSFPLSLL